MTILGDIANYSSPFEYETLREVWSTQGVPLVPVVGNHDWDDLGVSYRKFFGPPMYSFDSGGVHVVVLNSMDTEANRLAFLELDGSLPHTGQLVAAFMHFPAAPDVDPDPTPALADAGVDVLFTGHVHASYAPDHVGLKEYVTQTLVMGGLDFTPAGYRVVRHLGGGLLRVRNHTTVRERVGDLVFPIPGSCARAGRMTLLAMAEVGASTPLVQVVVGGKRVTLTHLGGWAYGGEVELGARADHKAMLQIRWGQSGAIDRTYDLCVRQPWEPPALSNDWGQLGGGADHRGALTVNLDFPLTLVWAQAIGGHALMGSPVLADDRLFVSVVDLDDATRGGVVAIDAKTGGYLWEARPGPSVRNAPAAGFGQVFFVTTDGLLRAVDAATGTPTWSKDVSNGNWTYVSPALVDGQVLVATPQAFRSLDPVTGEEIFVRDPGARIPGVISVASVAAGSGIAVTPMPEGRDGVLGWDMSDGRELWRILPPYTTHMRASPVVVDDTVYLTNVESRVTAIDLVTGQTAWSTQLYDFGEILWGRGIAATPAFAEGRLYVPTSNGMLYSVDALSGEVAWAIEAEESLIRPLAYERVTYAFLAAPVVAGSTVWIGGADGVLRAVHAGNGLLVYSLEVGSPIVSGLVVSPPYLFVAGYDGIVRAYLSRSALPPVMTVVPPPDHDDDGGCRIAAGPEPSFGAPFAFLAALFLARALLRRG
jgi:outer membrane protein assembly factor BamB